MNDMDFVSGYDTGRNEGYAEGHADGYADGYRQGRVVGWGEGFDAGHAVGGDSRRWKIAADWVFAIAALLMALVLAASWASAKPPMPGEKPAPPLSIELTCERMDMTQKEAMKLGAEDAKDWAKWANEADTDAEWRARIEHRMALLGTYAAAVAELNLGARKKDYLAGYALTVNAAFNGDVPDWAGKAFKRGRAQMLREMEQMDALPKCTEV